MRPRSDPEEGEYHEPVLGRESIDRLRGPADGRYLDATAGGGGHIALLLEEVGPRARVLGLDRDPEAVEAASRHLEGDRRVRLRRAEFDRLADIAAEEGMLPLDGVLMDLGVSSRQLDAPSRGFTWRQDAPLDMRMDPSTPSGAADLLAGLPLEEIGRILRELGEVRRWRALAADITSEREITPLLRSGDLRRIVEARTPPPARTKVLAQVFQALRIAVNDELGQLDRALVAAHDVLAEGGRLVVIAYHSLEDRRVKQFLRERSAGCTCPPDLPICACGEESTMRLPERRAVKASDEEVERNPRARSARLRWGVRVAQGERSE